MGRGFAGLCRRLAIFTRRVGCIGRRGIGAALGIRRIVRLARAMRAAITLLIGRIVLGIRAVLLLPGLLLSAALLLGLLCGLTTFALFGFGGLNGRQNP